MTEDKWREMAERFPIACVIDTTMGDTTIYYDGKQSDCLLIQGMLGVGNVFIAPTDRRNYRWQIYRSKEMPEKYMDAIEQLYKAYRYLGNDYRAKYFGIGLRNAKNLTRRSPSPT